MRGGRGSRAGRECSLSASGSNRVHGGGGGYIEVFLESSCRDVDQVFGRVVEHRVVEHQTYVHCRIRKSHSLPSRQSYHISHAAYDRHSPCHMRKSKVVHRVVEHQPNVHCRFRGGAV